MLAADPREIDATASHGMVILRPLDPEGMNDRTTTQLLNALIGLMLGYLIATRFRGRRTGLVFGLVWAAVSGYTSGRVHDRVPVNDLDVEFEPPTAADAATT